MLFRQIVIVSLVIEAVAMPFRCFSDEVDDALSVEKNISAQSVPAKPAKAAAATAKPKTQPGIPQVRKIAAPQSSAAQHDPGLASIIKDSEFITALEKKQDEVDAAKKEIDRLKGLIRKMVDVNRKEKATMHYNMGCVYKAGRLYKKAEAEFLQSLAISPDDPAIHYNLGVLYDDDLKDKPKAREHYKKFLKLAPGDPDAPKVEEWLIAIPEK